MALQHIFKLRVYKELKCRVGFEGLPSSLSFMFHPGTHGLFEELGRQAKRGGSQECPNCEACKESVEQVVFECASYIIPRDTILLEYACMK